MQTDEKVIYEQVGLMPASLYQKIYNSKQKDCLNLIDKGAEKDGAFKSPEYGTNWYSLSCSRSDFDRLGLMYCGDVNGKMTLVFKRNRWGGLRAMFALDYNQNNKIVKDCKVEKDLARVIYNNIQCFWINKAECESGQEDYMLLFNEFGEKSAKPYNAGNKSADYSEATQLRQQAKDYITSGASQEELAMLLTLKRSSKDNYESFEVVRK